MNHNPTEDEIVETLLVGMDDDELIKIRRLMPEDLIMLHHSLGAYIRNTYGLWNKGWTPEVTTDGIDESEDHPDAISMRIIEKLHAKLTND